MARPRRRVIDGPTGAPAWNLSTTASSTDEDAPPTRSTRRCGARRGSTWKRGCSRSPSGIHQLRGFDLSEITIVEGDEGFIVIDPLISVECAAAAMALARGAPGRSTGHRGDLHPFPRRPLRRGEGRDHRRGRRRRSVPGDRTAWAWWRPRSARTSSPGRDESSGAVHVRSHPAARAHGARSTRDSARPTRSGTITLIHPTDTITETGQRLTVDGVEIEFQLTPGTEAPAEMNFWFPQFRALCMAENCSHNLHNLYTPRGAQVRDALAWAKYLDESIVRYEGKVDLVFTSHHWPVWGAEESMALPRHPT